MGRSAPVPVQTGARENCFLSAGINRTSLAELQSIRENRTNERKQALAPPREYVGMLY